MKIKQALAVMVAAVSLAACGAKVEVPPAFVGKVLTKNGYAPETVPPSKFRLPVCFAYCDKLVLLQAADAGFTETMTVFMPDDKLNLTVEVRGTMSVPTTKRAVDMLFDRLTAAETDDSDVSIIRANMVYSTYGQPALRGIIRSEITKSTIAEVLKNREAIGQNIHVAIREKMEETNTPLVISRFELADVQPPPVIVKAQEAAAERDIAVQKAEANARVAMVEAERALEIAKKERLVEREKAAAIAEQNEIAAKSITPQLLEYRRLEVQERVMTALANSKNEGLIVVPLDTSSINSTTNAAIFGKVAGKEMK
jgi:regulator of protease activity HflC (stomatin/prohibitin superfamily)